MNNKANRARWKRNISTQLKK